MQNVVFLCLKGSQKWNKKAVIILSLAKKAGKKRQPWKHFLLFPKWLRRSFVIDFFMFAERTGSQILDGFSVVCLMSVLACILVRVFWSVPVRYIHEAAQSSRSDAQSLFHWCFLFSQTRYERKRVIGRGNFATVYEGICKKTGKEVAIKRVNISSCWNLY